MDTNTKQSLDGQRVKEGGGKKGMSNGGKEELENCPWSLGLKGYEPPGTMLF